MKCGNCEADVPDTELFCAACGAATIPQSTRVELQSRIDKRHETSNRWDIRLTKWGFVIGIGLSALAMVAFVLQPEVFGPAAQANRIETFLGLCFAPLPFALFGGLLGTLLDLSQRTNQREGGGRAAPK